LLSAAIVEDLELIWVFCGWRTRTVVGWCWWWWWRPKHVEQLSDKINSVTCAFCWDLYIRILLRCMDPWT
jgi:hypothetical protein